MKQFNHSPHHWTRRRLLRLGVTGAIPIAVAQISSCTTHNLLSMGSSKQTNLTTGRLRARPTQPTETGSAGLHPLGLSDSRDGVIYVPAGYRGERSAPLILMLHGAGGDAEGAMNILQDLADPFETILLAVDSRRQTWDVIMSQYGPDVAFIDQALTQTFTRYAIDPNRIAIAGFSDGASYALSVGLTNGDLFKHIIAFSPGFMAPADQVGSPRLFVSHGQRDTVLPIDRCSRRIVPRLQQAGYDVLYQEFDGPHTVPGEIRRAALEWFMNETAATP
ncbi:phospholipase [Oculatella sp. FACHB-28]|nr:phospholipase [Oculatella sp. FACHB-28]